MLGRCEHDLVVAVCAALCGVDTFVEITTWAEAKLDWLKRFLKLENGIVSHDTYSRLLAMIPLLLETLMLEGAIVTIDTIDAMSTLSPLPKPFATEGPIMCWPSHQVFPGPLLHFNTAKLAADRRNQE